MKPDQTVQQLQAYIKSVRPLGIGYAFPADGLMTPQFISVLNYIQSAYSGEGHKISLLNGSSVNPSGIAQLQKLLNIDAPPPSPEEKKSPEKLKEKEESLPEIKTLEQSESDKTNEGWARFLNQSLPVVGNVYDGDLAKSAKNLEVAIGNEIGKSMSGVIWNDAKKSFNTTPDDIKNALDKIIQLKQNTTKSAQFTQDYRVLKMAALLQKWEIEKK